MKRIINIAACFTVVILCIGIIYALNFNSNKNEYIDDSFSSNLLITEDTDYYSDDNYLELTKPTELERDTIQIEKGITIVPRTYDDFNLKIMLYLTVILFVIIIIVLQNFGKR